MCFADRSGVPLALRIRSRGCATFCIQCFRRGPHVLHGELEAADDHPLRQQLRDAPTNRLLGLLLLYTCS